MRLNISWILFLNKTTARKYSGPVALVHLGLKRTGHEWAAMVLRLDRRSSKTKETGLNTTPPSPTHTPIKRIPMCIAGLHVTSRRPCWGSRTKEFLSSGNWILFSCKFFEKKFCSIDPQHGCLVTWLHTKNYKAQHIFRTVRYSCKDMCSLSTYFIRKL